MLRKPILCLMIVLSLCVLAACTPSDPVPESIAGDGTLIVNGKTISRNIRFNEEDHHAELPLIAVVKELGAEVKWTSKTTAKIQTDQEVYLLDTTAHTLKPASNSKDDYFDPIKHGVLGGPYTPFLCSVDNEFIVDSYTLVDFLEGKMGYVMCVFFESKVVEIIPKDEFEKRVDERYKKRASGE